jgi:hypothetical protein
MFRLAEIMNSDIESNGLTALTLDWKEFDASVPAWLIHKAFQIIGEFIDF